MTPSETRYEAGEALEVILQLLDESHFRRVIDLPIDQAAASYPSSDFDPRCSSLTAFVDCVSGLVAHLCRSALSPPKILTGSQAREEAIHLLDTFYDGRGERGYETAYVDCLDAGRIGMEMLFLHIAGTMKSSQRRRYVQWIFTTRIRSQSWRFKRNLVAACINQYGGMLPETIRKCSPERLVPICHKLVDTIAAARNELRSRVGGFWSG